MTKRDEEVLVLPTLNRSAIAVTPGPLFLEWLNATDPASPALTAEDLGEPVIYLLPECEEERQLTAELRKHCRAIFETELEAWYTDRSTWPAVRDFRTFRKWFEYRTCGTVCDAGVKPIRLV